MGGGRFCFGYLATSWLSNLGWYAEMIGNGSWSSGESLLIGN
ncbi:phosphoenolpyruvate carboxykinase [Corchorus olitorius]|uniref:Phosphoenolpyruvate carboxykinase n=1 Tax=Corchorus olitorius TaxID=93759 RepID=A0A1R3ICG9_9ROSI|nr:phosphoenolpyruvate carboxykinase [Corchorus olitorius]